MTNREDNGIEKLLKDNLSDKQAVVPGFVWDRIEAEIYPKKKRRGFFWLFFGILLLGGTTGAYFLLHGNKALAANHKKVDAGKELRVSPRAKAAEKAVKENDLVTALDPQNPAAQSKPQQNDQQHAAFSAGMKIKDQHAGNGRSATAGSAIENTGTGKVINAGTMENAGSGSATAQSTGATPENKQSGQSHAAVKDSATADIEAIHPERLHFLPFTVLAANYQLSPDASQIPVKPADPKPARFYVNLYGGPSLYNIAVFKDYFTSGQLSNRTFKSSGFEAGAGFGFQLTRKWGIYSNLAFNRKQTSFNYNLAISESDYFNLLLHNELIPIASINDDGINNCFLAENVAASYKVDSWMLSLGSTYEIWKWRKFRLGADLRFSANLSAALKMDELTVIQVADYAPEHFNSLKTGAGLTLDYQFSRNFSLGIAPIFSMQFNGGKSFYAGRMQELLVPVSVKYRF